MTKLLFQISVIACGVFGWQLFPSFETSTESPFGTHFWIIESAAITPATDIDQDGIPDTDLLKLVPDCERDDARQFRSDGSIVTHRGKIRCEEDEEVQEETGTWTFDSKTKKLVMKNDDSRRENVSTLTEARSNRLTFVSVTSGSKGSFTVRTVLRVK